jgi:hypothetical protein
MSSWEELSGDELLDRLNRAEARIYKALSHFPDNHPMQRWIADWGEVLHALEWVANMGAPSSRQATAPEADALTGAETVEEATAWIMRHWKEFA